MIVTDTSVVVAFMNRRDDEHERVAAWMDGIREDLVTTPMIVAEIDHLVSRGGGDAATLAFYEDLSAGAYIVEWWPQAMTETIEIAEKYQALDIGISDASLVALAARFGTNRIATLDERHFRMLEPLTGEDAFVLLPADAS